MSSGDNEWVGCFPSNDKRSSVIISSPMDFCYSRNNTDTIRSLRHRTSGVHIFPFLPYSLARQIFPLPCLPPEVFSGVRSRLLCSGASQKTYHRLCLHLSFLSILLLVPLLHTCYVASPQRTSSTHLTLPYQILLHLETSASAFLSLQRSLSLLPLLPSLPTLFT